MRCPILSACAAIRHTYAPFDPAHKYVTSPLVRAPLAFAALRLGIAFYILTTLLVTLIWKAVVTRDADTYFSYFTYLTYTGLCAYYFAAGVQTLAYALTRRRARSTSGCGYPLQRWPRALQVLHVLLQSTVTTFPIVVTAVFWALLADASTFADAYSAWSNISIHAFNTVFALVEILASNAPPAPWLALPVQLVILCAYLGVAYVTKATQGFYPYSFLDPHKQGPLLAAYIVGIAAAQTLVFCAVRGVSVLRERWAVKTGRVGAVVEEQEGDIEEGWEEVDVGTVEGAEAKSAEEGGGGRTVAVLSG